MVRIPTHRPPVHPGEMLLEEFLLPMGITQRERDAIESPYQRVNEIVNGKRVRCHAKHGLAFGQVLRDDARFLDESPVALGLVPRGTGRASRVGTDPTSPKTQTEFAGAAA